MLKRLSRSKSGRSLDSGRVDVSVKTSNDEDAQGQGGGRRKSSLMKWLADVLPFILTDEDTYDLAEAGGEGGGS